jgi:hypothetical protein
MAKKLITNNLRLHLAEQFKESFTEEANTIYYMFAARPQDYSENVPQPIDTYQSTMYDIYNDMVFGKRITENDVVLMIPKVEWEANTVYIPYDANNVMYGNNFYVSVVEGGNYNVFKVLDIPKINDSYIASNTSPLLSQTAADDEYYSTSDGYVWKYMYQITNDQWDKYTTDNWMPVLSNNNVEGNAVSGAIDVIRIQTKGSNYDAILSNTFTVSQISVLGNPLLYDLPQSASSNTGFYTQSCIYVTSGGANGEIRKIVDYDGPNRRITIQEPFDTPPETGASYEIGPLIEISGDGSGAQARGLINTDTAAGNSFYSVEIVSRGSNYSYATVTIGSNTGGVSNAAILVPIIGPVGGHGSNAAIELGARAIGIGISFQNNESGKITTSNDIRTFGVVKNPKFANVQLTVTGAIDTFTTGGTVYQVNTNASGIVTTYIGNELQLTNASGIFVTGQRIYQPIDGGGNTAEANVSVIQISGQVKDFNTYDQTYKVQYDTLVDTFISDEIVIQTEGGATLASGIFHSANATTILLTDVKGVFNTNLLIEGQTSGATANVVSRTLPDLVKYSGEVLFIENVSEIARSNNQTEEIKIVLKF